jgi:hypothetical protein
MKFNWFCTGNSLLTSWAITWYSWRIPLVSRLHIKYSNSEYNLIVSGIPLIISHRRLHIVEKLLTSLLASDLTSCPFCFINQAKVIRNYRTANYTLSPVNTNVIKSCTIFSTFKNKTSIIINKNNMKNTRKNIILVVNLNNIKIIKEKLEKN